MVGIAAGHYGWIRVACLDRQFLFIIVPGRTSSAPKTLLPYLAFVLESGVSIL